MKSKILSAELEISSYKSLPHLTLTIDRGQFEKIAKMDKVIFKKLIAFVKKEKPEWVENDNKN